jgi:hypothetical protein
MEQVHVDVTLHVTAMHFILAYAGMIIHVLLKLGELRKSPEFSLKGYVKKHIFSMIASVITIPVLLIMACEPAVAEMLPLNYITATLIGWQTNSTFKALMGMYGKKSNNTPAEDR